MKFYNNKLKLLFLVFIFFIQLISCSLDEGPRNSPVNVTELIKYKDFYVGDSTAVGHIISNLPGNIYNEGYDIQTQTKPYSIDIKYNSFNTINISFDDNSDVIDSFPSVLKKNASILLSLLNSAEEINFIIDEDTIITYEKNDLINENTQRYGEHLEKITSSPSSIENFLKAKNIINTSDKVDTPTLSEQTASSNKLNFFTTPFF